jgi:lipoprotein-anchoring transpeptidase ErfK/SrfK
MTAIVDRRVVLAALGACLSGCTTPRGVAPYASLPGTRDAALFAAYGPIEDDGHRIPALDPATVNPDVLRRQVPFAGPYRPGTIVVDIPDRRLYLVQPGGMAMRYTVGVGREEALNFRGSAVIGRKAVWPRWAPTETMIETMPRYAAYAGGMVGGIGNPLGARALYLYRGNKDTLFRLHGTNEPETIGTAVSSGCIRLFNHDIIDLYNRVPVGAPVVVLQEPGPMADLQEPAPATVSEGPGPAMAAPEPGEFYRPGPYAGEMPYGAGPYAGPDFAAPLMPPSPWVGPY